MKRFRTLIAFSVVIIVILVIIGFRIVNKVTADAQQKQQADARKTAPVPVNVSVAGPKAIALSAKAPGTLESPFQVNLSPNTAGRIDYLQVREGDQVKKGDVLARIDPQEVEGEILAAQAAYDEAQQKLSQAKITENANTIGIESTIQQQKAGVASSEADYHEVVATIEQTIGAAHQATVDAQAKVAAAQSAVSQAEANLHVAEANLDDAQSKFTRTDNLYKQGFDSPQDRDDALASVKVNKATVNAQQKSVEAANSALKSTQAEYEAAANQEAITIKKSKSDTSDAAAKLTQSHSTLDSAVANRAQIPAYTENLKALQSEVVNAKAALDQAVARRAYLVVTSPIDGTVSKRSADPGAEATPGSPILVVETLDQLFLTVNFPVDVSKLIHPGMDMTFQADGFPGQTFHATVKDINHVADPASRQFMVRAIIDNRTGQFHPGMYTQVQVVTSHVDAPVVVPMEAVKTTTSGTSTVTVVSKDMTAHKVTVTLGMQDSSQIQILSGVKAGDQVVTLSYRTIQDGGKVSFGSSKRVQTSVTAGYEPDKMPKGSVRGASIASEENDKSEGGKVPDEPTSGERKPEKESH